MSRGLFCPTCQATRLHRVRLTARKRGRRIRVRVLACTVCEVEHPIPIIERPGLSCPKCEGQILRVDHVRYLPGRIVRIKKCVACSHLVRTREIIESVTA